MMLDYERDELSLPVTFGGGAQDSAFGSLLSGLCVWTPLETGCSAQPHIDSLRLLSVEAGSQPFADCVCRWNRLPLPACANFPTFLFLF